MSDTASLIERAKMEVSTYERCSRQTCESLIAALYTEISASKQHLHSAMALMETVAESLPKDDINAIMLSVMAGNIRGVISSYEESTIDTHHKKV